MDRVGNLEDVTIRGCIFLYSGQHRGMFAAAFGGKKTETGISQETFVTDLTPSGLVRSYNHRSVWKLRYMVLRLCSDGIELTIWRPPKWGSVAAVSGSPTSPRRAASASPMRPSPSSPSHDDESESAFVGNDSEFLATWEADTLYAAETHKQRKGTLKTTLTLSDAPVTVRKLSLTSEVSGVARRDLNFSLRCANGVRGTFTKLDVPFVLQVSLERNGLLEFCSRDVDHLETWFERMTMISIVHRTFHQVLRTVRNVSQYPAPQNVVGEFTIAIANGAGASASSSTPMDGMLSVMQNEYTGFAVWLRGDAHGSSRYFRLCFDETPLLLAECAIISVIEVLPEEHDRCCLARSVDDVAQIFSTKRSIRLRIERPSVAALGRMFYFNKWCSFISTFCRHYEGVVEDRLLRLPSQSSFRTSRGGNDTSSVADRQTTAETDTRHPSVRSTNDTTMSEGGRDGRESTLLGDDVATMVGDDEEEVTMVDDVQQQVDAARAPTGVYDEAKPPEATAKSRWRTAFNSAAFLVNVTGTTRGAQQPTSATSPSSSSASPSKEDAAGVTTPSRAPVHVQRHATPSPKRDVVVPGRGGQPSAPFHRDPTTVATTLTPTTNATHRNDDGDLLIRLQATAATRVDEDAKLCAAIPVMVAHRDLIGVMEACRAFRAKHRYRGPLYNEVVLV